MKRLLIPIMLGITSHVTVAAFADGSDQNSVANLFSWLMAKPPDWGQGVLLAILGLVGALVTIFGLIGGVVPGTAGQVKIEADGEKLDIMSEKLVELVKAPSPNPALIQAVEKTVEDLRHDLDEERSRQFRTAAFLYAVLGAFLATLLARDILQALVIGAGWTTLIGTLGLKKDYADRKSTKDAALKQTLDALETSVSRVKALEASLEKSTGQSVQEFGLGTFQLHEANVIDDLRANARVALAI